MSKRMYRRSWFEVLYFENSHLPLDIASHLSIAVCKIFDEDGVKTFFEEDFAIAENHWIVIVMMSSKQFVLLAIYYEMYKQMVSWC